MVVRITERCRMGCSHCMVDATPEGRRAKEEKTVITSDSRALVVSDSKISQVEDVYGDMELKNKKSRYSRPDAEHYYAGQSDARHVSLDFRGALA